MWLIWQTNKYIFIKSQFDVSFKNRAKTTQRGKTTRNFENKNSIQLIPYDKKMNRKLYSQFVCVFVKLIMIIDRQNTNQIKTIRYSES